MIKSKNFSAKVLMNNSLIELYKKFLARCKNNNIPEIELRMLLCYINGIDNMSVFYLKQDENIKDLQRFYTLLERLFNGEPIQYIIGEASFCGRDFIVDSRVLIPRMETEEMVSLISKIINKNYRSSISNLDIVDVCTGSGCIAVTLSLEFGIKVDASDISDEALEIAEKNVIKNHAKVALKQSDLLSCYLNQGKKFDLIVGNPPYIINKDEIDKRSLYEPSLALSPKGESVVSLYDRLLYQSTCAIKKGGSIILEIGYDMKDILIPIINKYFPGNKYDFIKDINSKDRFLLIETR